MAIYRFRVSFEEYDDVYRDIEIRSVQTFEQFHYAIQESIGFDASKPASFYMSNDLWKKGQEISLQNSNGSGAVLMKDARLSDFIADPHQKIYYVFDPPSQWSFFIELFKIVPDPDNGKKYPLCVKINGEAPKQYLTVEPPKGLVDSEFIDDAMFDEVAMDEEGDEDESREDGISTFGESVDEEEYDNIEEASEDESGKEDI